MTTQSVDFTATHVSYSCSGATPAQVLALLNRLYLVGFTLTDTVTALVMAARPHRCVHVSNTKSIYVVPVRWRTDTLIPASTWVPALVDVVPAVGAMVNVTNASSAQRVAVVAWLLPEVDCDTLLYAQANPQACYFRRGTNGLLVSRACPLANPTDYDAFDYRDVLGDFLPDTREWHVHLTPEHTLRQLQHVRDMLNEDVLSEIVTLSDVIDVAQCSRCVGVDSDGDMVLYEVGTEVTDI